MQEEVLRIENLKFGYSKKKILFENFNLTLHKGELKSIIGESGAGKSTVFELILGNLKPLEGSLHVSRLSEVFQDPYSSFHPSYSPLNQMKDVASLDTLDDYLDTFGMTRTDLQKLPHELSGGQLQRASIIRALLMKPQLLLLDEPTSALDNVIQLDVMRLLMRHLDEMGMLLITHDIDLARWCSDEIVEIQAPV